jgi:hypothetical protein
MTLLFRQSFTREGDSDTALGAVIPLWSSAFGLHANLDDLNAQNHFSHHYT